MRDDMVKEGCEVGRARLELLDAVKAVTLAVSLKHNQKNNFIVLWCLPTMLTMRCV